jgi:hypothetical protein
MVYQRWHGNFLSSPWFLHSIELPGLGCGSHISTLQRKQVIKHTAARSLVSFHIGRASAKLSVARDCKGGSKLKGYLKCSCLAINSTIGSEVIPRLLICFRTSPSLVPRHVLATGPERPIKSFIGLIAPHSVQQPSHPQTPLLWTTVSSGCEVPNLHWRERIDHPNLLLFEKVF